MRLTRQPPASLRLAFEHLPLTLVSTRSTPSLSQPRHRVHRTPNPLGRLPADRHNTSADVKSSETRRACSSPPLADRPRSGPHPCLEGFRLDIGHPDSLLVCSIIPFLFRRYALHSTPSYFTLDFPFRPRRVVPHPRRLCARRRPPYDHSVKLTI